MFKEKLVELRKINSDTQESLAKRINVSRSLVAKWEQGRAYPNEQDLDNISKEYNVEIDDIMSAKELRSIYGKVTRKNRIKNILIIVLSFISVVAVSLSIVFGNRNFQTSYIDEEKGVEQIDLFSYSNPNGTTNLVGNKDYDLLFKNEYGYSYDLLQIERYPFTDKSHLYIIHYRIDAVPGYVAYANSLQEFNENSIINGLSVKTEFELNKGVKPIFGWPRKKETSSVIKSRYSDNYLLNTEINAYGINVAKNKNGDYAYYYDGNIMDVVMDNSHSYQIKKLETTDHDYISKRWDLIILEERSTKVTLGLDTYYLLEVNDLNDKIEGFNMKQEILVNYQEDSNNKIIKKVVEYTLHFKY